MGKKKRGGKRSQKQQQQQCSASSAAGESNVERVQADGGGDDAEAEAAATTLVEQWARTIRPHDFVSPELAAAAAGPDPRHRRLARLEHMSRLGLDEAFLLGLEPVGDWSRVRVRMMEQAQPPATVFAARGCGNPACDAGADHACSRCKQVGYCGAACQKAHWKVHKKACRALRVGDTVEVVSGNNIKQSVVGSRGVLAQYFEDDGKWGIEMDSGEPVLISKMNLRRVKSGLMASLPHHAVTDC